MVAASHHSMTYCRWGENLRLRPKSDAFTLVEVMVAVAVLGLFASGALWSLTQANDYAVLSRLYTGAQIAAQSQIDLIMSKGPFNPQKGQVPAVLSLDPHVSETVTLYSDPGTKTSGPIVISGQRTTQVNDTIKTVSGRSLNMYSAVVVVSFSYRGKPHHVQLNTLRASDVDGDS
jgi:prepilin-type N-terminal cleavage/methylation domain-containing protein